MFHRLFKNLDFRQKYSAAHRIQFNSLLSASGNPNETPSLVFDILLPDSRQQERVFVTVLVELIQPLDRTMQNWIHMFRQITRRPHSNNDFGKKGADFLRMFADGSFPVIC